MQTVQAIQRFQMARTLASTGDVSTIRPWMTIPDISHLYHVPENYLYESLNITNPQPAHRTSLRSLAVRYNRSLNGIISNIQTAIKTYRKQHPPHHLFASRHINQSSVLEKKKT
jgi:hypothetical protein